MSKHTITGVVSSIAGEKTIVITRTVRETHPLYGKKFTTTSKYHAYDDQNKANVGDTVSIIESRPHSKTVTWELKEVISKGREKLTVKKAEIEEELAAKANKSDREDNSDNQEVAE